MPKLKETAIKAISSLPDEANMDDIMYRMYILTRLEQARKEVAEGDLIEQEKVEEMMKKWIIE